MCSCLPDFIGVAPACRPECTTNNECPLDKACINRKCSDPCPGVCGQNAECQVRNHNPICSCRPGMIGDPFVRCYPQPRKKISHDCGNFRYSYCYFLQNFTYLAQTPPVKDVQVYRDPCVPSPCGPFSQCRNQYDTPSCSCLPNYIGSPPNCRPECTINADCPSSQACINEKCRDPCPGACGINTECTVINHIPNCKCQLGYVGDAFVACQPAPPPPIKDEPRDPCYPNPCGSNAICSGDGICSCVADYQGDPYVACKPECVLNSECPSHLACLNQKCRDPCPGTCASNAICEVRNHIPMCHCPERMTGNAFVLCQPIQQSRLNCIQMCKVCFYK